MQDQLHIQSNRESGDGRFDICLLPKQARQTGILIEFKKTDEPDQLEHTAKLALEQIIDRRYDTIFRQHGTEHVLCLGVGFAARDVKIVTSRLQIEK